MVNKIQFIHKDLIVPVVVIGVFLLILFLWKEKKSTNGRKFVINSIVSFVAIISLAFIALKPALYTKSELLEMAILTDNYKPESLDSLQKMNKNLVIKDYQKGKNMLDKNINPTQVFVLGNGVEEYDLWQLKNIPTKYIKGNSISGITRLKYNSKLSVGEILSVKGLFNTPQKGNKLFLEFSKTKLDSIVFDNSEKQEFQLKSKVKVADKFLYSLVERDSLNREIESNPLPVEVQKKESIKVLILNSFPTFDTKYLKNFLAENGHQVVVRNRLTKGKYKYEYFNTKRERVSISTNSLKAFDLLVIDATSFLHLSSRQRNSIKKVIEKEGLGMFIQPEINLFMSRNRLVSFEFLRDKSNSFILEGIKKSIPKYNYVFKNDNQLETIHKISTKVYSAFKYLGKGKVGSTVGQQTYQLFLSGNTTSFKQFWTEIINAISKKQLKESFVKSATPFAYVDEPFSFELQTNFDKPIIKDKEGSEIPLIQNVHQPDIWIGKVYPKSIGWNHINIEKDSINTFLFYTIKQGDYKVLKAFSTSINNKRYLNNSEKRFSNFESLKTINLIWFYILFVLCIAYLWLTPKL